MGNESSASAEEEKDEIDDHFLVPSDFTTNTRQIILHDASFKNNRTLQEFLSNISVRYPQDAIELLKSKDALLCLPFHHAVAGGHLEAVTALAQQYVDFRIFPNVAALVNQGVANSSTSLHVAVVAGHLDIVKYLLSVGADVTKKTSSQSTPLHVACTYGDLKTEGGSLEMVQLFVQAGAPLNDRTSPSGETALEIAATLSIESPAGQTEQEDIVLYLLEQPGIDIKFGGENASPLPHTAAEKGFTRVWKKLALDSNNLQTPDKNGDTPMHIAAQASKIEIVQLLLEGRAACDLKNNKGETPLVFAVSAGDENMTKLLIAAGADINHATEAGSLLCLSCKLEGPEIAKILLSCGIDVTLSDKDKNTALHTAAAAGHLEVARVILEALRAHGDTSLLNVKNKNGQTPLYIAASTGTSRRLVDFFLKFGANPNELTNSGDSALHIAASKSALKIMQSLIAGKIDVNLLNSKGLTALECCVESGFKEGVQLLLKENATYNSSVRDKALALGHKEISDLLNNPQ